MSYLAYITDKQTGETRACHMDLEWQESSPFWWGDGNYRCDCNRGSTFARAGGEDVDALDDDEDDERFPCGRERYSVSCISDDGDVLYEDSPSKAEDAQDG